MADVLTWFLLILGIIIVYNCYWLATRALFPGLVARCEESYSRPFRVTGIGLVVGAPLIALVIFIISGKNPAIKITGGIFLTVAVLAGLAGSTGLAQRIGAGLNSATDDQQPWRKVLRGGPVLAFACLLPFLGWFVLQPWILLSGIGALVISITPSRKPLAVVPPPTLSESKQAAQ